MIEDNNIKSKSGPNSAAREREDIKEDKKMKALENEISYFNIYSKKDKNKNYN